MGRVIEAFKQFFDSAGDPLSMGWLRFLEAGSNNTLKDTFYDAQYQGKNENPVRLSADGRCPDVFGRGSYRVISYENDPSDETTPGALVQVKDPVQAAVDEIATGGGGGFQSWSAIETYQLLDIVTYDGVYYRSIIIDNLNNTPPLEPFAWEEIEFLEIWNETITYNEGDFVRYEENLFFSKTGANLNNQPDINPTYWRRVDTEVVAVQVKTDDYSILVGDRDNLLILGNTTIANRTFTLPIVDATYSGFRVFCCNDSDYELTILPGAGNDLWFDTTNDITIQKGAMLELRYCSNQNRWGIYNNVGPALGGQDIGTTTRRVNTLFVTDIEAETMALSSAVNLADDVSIYFGDANEAELVFNSTTVSFDLLSSEDIKIDTAKDLFLHADTNILLECPLTIDIQAGGVMDLDAGTDMQINYIDHVYFFRSGVLHWDIQSDGKIVPGAAIPNAWIGLDTNPIDEMHMGTDSRIYFGAGNWMRISHDGANGYFSNNTGNMNFFNGAGVDLAFFIDASKDCHAFQNFYNRADRKHFFDESDTSYIYYNSSDSELVFGSGSTAQWGLDVFGNMIPKTSTNDIGDASNPVQAVFADILIAADEVKSPNMNAPSGSPLDLGIYGGATVTRYIRLTDYVTSGSNMEIRFTWNSANYKLTATPA